MRTLNASLTLLLCAAPLSAQVPYDFEGALAALRSQAAETESAAKRRPAPRLELKAVSAALTAMDDGNEVGALVLSALRERGVDIRIVPGMHGSSLQEDRERGKTYITLGDSLPPYPRILASYVAREASSLMFSDMPDCAEREYMRRSVMARVWLELGGEPAALPVIEPLIGYQDQALAADLRLWLGRDAQMALQNIGEATGAKTLPELMSEDSAQMSERFFTPEALAEKRARLKSLEEANARFTDFLMAESLWRRSNAGRIGR